MITRFYVNNFKNLLNLEFRADGLECADRSKQRGQDNLCQAMQVFALASCMSLKDAVQFAIGGEVWNLTNAYQENDVSNLKSMPA